MYWEKIQFRWDLISFELTVGDCKSAKRALAQRTTANPRRPTSTPLTHKSASPSRPSPWITGGLSASAPCEGQTPRPWHLLHHTQCVETLWGIALSLWKERKSQLIVSVSFALEKEDQAYFRFSMIMENLIFDLKISYEKKSVFTLSWLWVMSENLPWSLVRSGSGASF